MFAPISSPSGKLRTVTIDPAPVLDLRFERDRLTLTLTPRPGLVPGQAGTFDVVIGVQAWPFSGRVEDIALEDDLRHFAVDLERMTVPGAVTYGGDRTVELVLSVGPQDGGGAGRFVVEASTTGGGDPWPRLTMLLLDQEAFWLEAAEKILRLLDGKSP